MDAPLFELGGPRHHEAPGLQLAHIALVVVSVGLFRWYLGLLSADGAAPAPSAREEPTL